MDETLPHLERDQRLADLLTKLTDQAARGQPVELDQACADQPELADELRQLWGAAAVADIARQVSSSRVGGAGAASGRSFELPGSFGDYLLIEELGRGGMGVVFRARQLSLRRDVAVKMTLAGDLASAADRGRFRAEAESAGRLDHPGIVPVFEVGEWEGQPYFSMRYVPGRTLAQRLADGPLPPRDAARILAQVARAIHFAHEQGVLHRDLKPSNILLDEDGRAFVTDFGLAKRVAGAESITRTGAVLGTPAYMAPEQAAGARGEIGPPTDVYSLGAMLYQMLTGHPPFQAASPVDTLLMVLDQDLVPPRVVNPRADRDLEMIALRCLQKPLDLRYPTAAALADDLEAYLSGEPIAARGGRLANVISQLFRETHHAPLLENWGLLWMWHSLVLLAACGLTEVWQWFHLGRAYYIGLWTLGLWIWAGVFWWLRARRGPVTFVERQIAHVWGGAMAAIALLFGLEIAMDLPVLTLSPVLGLVAGLAFVAKAGILSGWFYFQAAALFATAFAMARWPQVSHLLFGVVSALCFFLPGWQYHRRYRAAAKRAVR